MTLAPSLARSIALTGALLTASAALPPTARATESTRTLYLVRHGDYDHEDERDPEVGKALVPLGVAQARLVAARFRGLPVEFSTLHASPMTRARETARVIGQDLGLTPRLDPRLRECTPPTWRQDVMEGEDPEDLTACREQIDEAWSRLSEPAKGGDQYEIVVGHGNVIRSFVVRALGVDPESWLGMSIGNCSLTVIQIASDGTAKVLAFSDTGHIPPNLETRTAPGEPRDLKVP